MHKKITLLFGFFLIITGISHAQPSQEGRFKRAEQVLGEYLTKELNLTPDESEKLKPVYRNYLIDLRSVKKENNSDPIATEEKILTVRKKYREDFRKILISEERVNKLFIAGKKFRDILRKELIERRLNRSGTRDSGIQ